MRYIPFSTLRKAWAFLIKSALAAVALLMFQAAQAEDIATLSTIKTDPALAAMVPKIYRERGTLVAGVNPDVKPIKFVDDDGNFAGFTPDLLSAAAKVLNLKVELTQTSFDALIPGLSSGRLDVLLSLADFDSRHKVVTFIDYLDMGDTLIVSPKSTVAVHSYSDLCGLQVALPRGSATVPKSTEISKECVKSGKKPLSVATYPDSNMTLLSLSTGASQVAWVDSPVGNYNASQFPEKYKVAFYAALAPYGIGFGTDQNGKQLAAVMQLALQKLNEDGVYGALLKKWGLDTKDGRPLFPINSAKL